jgi:hypothetical protein
VNRELGRAWLHLAVLWTLAFAKPLFDVLEDSPDFFVARGNTSGDIVIFALAFTLLPPTLLALVELAAARLPALARALHLVFVGGLFAAFAVQVLDDAVGGSSELLVAAALALGVAGAWAYARARLIPSILTVLGPAPLVLLFVFLVTSPVSKLVFPDDGAQAAETKPSRNVPIVMIVFDEFDPNMLSDARGRIDRTRYPNFAALAGDSTWYRNATTVNSQTTLAVPALMSGRRPTPDMVPVTSDYPNSLPTLFASSHELNVTETATQLCPARLCGDREREPEADRLSSLAQDLGIVSLHLVAPSGLEHRLPAVDRTFGDFAGGGADDQATTKAQPDVPMSALTNRPAQFDHLMGGLHPQRAKPTLSFLHAALPHIPWQYLPGGQEYVNAGPDYPGLASERWSGDPFLPRLAMQRHLLQVGYADHLLGRVLARLRVTGIYRKALIVVTADHGVSYRPGEPRRSPDDGNASDIAGVPLLIKYPGRRGGRIDDSFVRTIDVVPTIVHAVGGRLPYDADGRPVEDGGPGSGEVRVDRGASGTHQDLSFADFVRERRVALARMVGLFGSDDGGRRLYANGPNWDLLGRATASLPEADSADARVELDSASQLDDFRPGAHLVPSFLSGQISGSLGADVSLAVAINGRIRSVTESFRNDGRLRLAAIAPADSFRAGSNRVEVFAVRGSGPGRRLAPLRTTEAEQYRLVDGGTALEGAGRRFELTTGKGLQGFVDQGLRDDQGVRLGGWAADVAHGRPAERILVFAGNRLVAQAQPTIDRPDVAKNLGSGVTRSGYELIVPVQGERTPKLRTFAIAGDSARELPVFKR